MDSVILGIGAAPQHSVLLKKVRAPQPWVHLKTRAVLMSPAYKLDLDVNDSVGEFLRG
jgi:hypothetical protein